MTKMIVAASRSNCRSPIDIESSPVQLISDRTAGGFDARAPEPFLAGR
jgi:hypothetical protein